jgi:hypothetical protein
VTPAPIARVPLRLEQLKNAAFPMVVTPAPIVRVPLRLEQLKNAWFPMVVTELPIARGPVRLEPPENALFPIPTMEYVGPLVTVSIGGIVVSRAGLLDTKFTIPGPIISYVILFTVNGVAIYINIIYYKCQHHLY